MEFLDNQSTRTMISCQIKFYLHLIESLLRLMTIYLQDVKKQIYNGNINVRCLIHLKLYERVMQSHFPKNSDQLFMGNKMFINFQKKIEQAFCELINYDFEKLFLIFCFFIINRSKKFIYLLAV